MSTMPDPLANEPAKDTPFCIALRWRVHDLQEALSIAATHRARAAEARSGLPPAVGSFQARSRALGLETRAARHDEMAAVCERHAARLGAAS